jgi:hypothetical protein
MSLHRNFLNWEAFLGIIKINLKVIIFINHVEVHDSHLGINGIIYMHGLCCK